MQTTNLLRSRSAPASPKTRNRRSRTATSSAAQFAYESLEARSLFSAVAWTGAGDGVNWSDPANWSGNAMPGSGDDVTINVAANPTINVTGNRSVRSLAVTEALTLNGGATLAVATTASVNANLTLNGGILSGGAWTFGSGASVQVGASSSNVITGATINGDLYFSINSARCKIDNGTTFTTAHLAADSTSIAFASTAPLTGTILYEGAQTSGRYVETIGAATFTIAPTGAIKTAPGFAGTGYLGSNFWYGGTMTLANSGLVSSESSGKQITINAPSMSSAGTLRAQNGATLQFNSNNWSSSGTISASGNSTLNFTGNWTNTGSISIDSSTLNLGGTLTTAGFNVAGFTRVGGTVNLTGTLTNTGAAITFNANTGNWNLAGGTIQGGQVSYADGKTLTLTGTGGFLKDVTVSGDLTLAADGAHVVASGATTFSTAHLIGNNSSIGFGNGYTLNSTVLFEGSGTQARYVEGYSGAGTLTIGPSGAIKVAPGYAGSSVTIGQNFWFGGSTTVVNNGLIRSDVAGRTVYIPAFSFTNNGAIEIVGGTLNLAANNWSNAAGGTLTANGSTVSFGGNWSNAGSLRLTNSPLTLGGTFSTSGFNFAGFSRSGTGAVDLTGTLNNTGSTLALDAASGPWNLLGGTVNGGQVNSISAQTLVMTGTGGSLNNVTVLGDVYADVNNAHVRINGTSRFNTVHLIGDTAAVGFEAGYTLQDTISFEGAGTQGRYVEVAGANGQFTVGPTGVIKTAPGFAGNASVGQNFWYGGTMALVNQGLISSETSGKTINLKAPTSTTISGTTRVLNGGVLNVDTSGPVNVTNTGNATVSRFRVNSLTVDGSAIVAPSGTNNSLSTISSLTFNGTGSLDLNNNDLILSYTGASPFATIQQMLNQSRNGGGWDGNGAIRSTSARNANPHVTTLAAMEVSEYKVVRQTNVFDGASVPANGVIVNYTYYGDANFDGRVTFDDYVRIDTGFNTGLTGWSNGDFNASGSVNFDDYVLIDIAFNQQSGTLSRNGERNVSARDPYQGTFAALPDLR